MYSISVVSEILLFSERQDIAHNIELMYVTICFDAIDGKYKTLHKNK